MSLRQRLRAAWTAFRRPDVPVEAPVPVPPPGQRFRVVRYYDYAHTILYPTRPGQDRGGEARACYELTTPQYVGEIISFYDGEHERSRKEGRA